MNLSTITLLVLAWQLLANSNGEKSPLDNVGSLLTEDNKAVVDNIKKLTDSTASAEDKTGAVLGLATNPSVAVIAEKLLGKKDSAPLINDEGFNLGTPSADSRIFFKEVDNVADTEVKSKLYKWYDWQYK